MTDQQSAGETVGVVDYATGVVEQKPVFDRSFLEFAVKTGSQYDGTCRRMAAQILLRDDQRQTAAEQLAIVTSERDEARDWVRKLTSKECTLTCVYCGHAYPPGTPDHGSGVLTAHISECEKHPMRAIARELAQLKGALAFFEETAAASIVYGEECDEVGLHPNDIIRRAHELGWERPDKEPA